MSIDDPNEPASTPSRRYWKAVISCLPTEKRDAAWEFYVNTLSEGNAGDTLSALILLLEAHGVFLLTLPEKLHGELIEPVTGTLRALRAELLSHVDGQRQSLVALDDANESANRAAKLIQQTNAELEGKVQTAVESIDVQELAWRIRGSLESSTLRPMQTALRNFCKRSEELQRATSAAEHSIAIWRRVHLGGVALCSLLGALLISAFIVRWYSRKLEAEHQHRVTTELAQFGGNVDAFQQLSKMGIKLRVKPWSGNFKGQPMKDACIVTIDGRSRAHSGVRWTQAGSGACETIRFSKCSDPSTRTLNEALKRSAIWHCTTIFHRERTSCGRVCSRCTLRLGASAFRFRCVAATPCPLPEK